MGESVEIESARVPDGHYVRLKVKDKAEIEGYLWSMDPASNTIALGIFFL